MARKQRNSEVDESAARLRALMAAAVDAIIVIDERGRVESFNPAAERMFGYAADAIVGQNVSRLMPEPHRSRHTQYIRHYVRTGEARIIGIGRESVGQRADGTLFPIELAVSEVVVGGRRTFTGMVRDISERKQLERAIVEASELERKQIGRDLHDTVSQQLAGLTMMAQVLEKKSTHPPSKGAPSLSAEARRVKELADMALRQVKAISHGLYPVELERNGLAVVLRQLAEQQETLFGQHCAVRTNARPDQVCDPGVAVQLYRIAQEAVSNALKHAQAATIEIAWECSPTVYTLTVRDDGVGFLPTKDEPVGLGLAIMRYRANMLDTELELISAPGAGTTVRCAVPLRTAQGGGNHDGGKE